MLLETRNITKSFSGVPVLNGISFRLAAGEVHALVGENGAGKTTFMKVLSGVHAPDGGELRLGGEPVRLPNAHQALRLGIAMIYQEPLPFPDLTVAENILMGQEPSRFGWLDRKRLNARAAELLRQLGVGLAPQTLMRRLRVAEIQAVEIAKALAHNARILIMDEPTSALSDREAEALFATIKELRSRGVAVIYISHKLEEIFRLADRITVLRDGVMVATHAASAVSREQLIAEMVGRPFIEAGQGTGAAAGEVLLSVSRLVLAGHFGGISFEVRRGEVLGLAGLMGAGRTEVLNAIYGLDPADSGEIRVSGRPVRIRSPRDALRAGIGLVTEDRKRFGFIPALAAPANITMGALERCCRAGWIRSGVERQVGRERIERFRIRGAHGNQPVERLSGGNQQKVVIARTLFTGPDILLLDEPTRGIDIAAKAEVHGIIRDLARSGKAVVLVSSELPELLALSDRMLVMREGALVGELDRESARPEEILRLAMPQ